jgi:hypothetical protein
MVYATFLSVASRVAEPSGLGWNLISTKAKTKSKNQHGNRFHHYEKCPLTQMQTECPIYEGAGEWENMYPGRYA